MVNLTYRAERALLGALLRDPASLNDIPFLTAGDFASEQHGQVFSAIAAAHARPLDDSPAPFEFAVAFSNSPPGISNHYLQNLSETCPDPANTSAYARMVMESSLRRQLLVHAVGSSATRATCTSRSAGSPRLPRQGTACRTFPPTS